jgi:hypothetical protein
MSNVHYVYEQLTDIDTAQTVTGPWTFSSSTTFTYLPTSTTTNPTEDGQFATKYYVDTVGAGGFTSLNVSTTRGLSVDGSSPERVRINASSTTGMTFDSSGRLYQALDSTLQWVANVLSVNTSTLLSQLTSITSAVGKIPVASSVTSTLHGSWFGTSTPGALFYVGPDGYSTALGVGSAGQSLRVNSGATAPTWVKTFAAGQASRASGAGTGSQNIAHGLGRIPTGVIIQAFTKTDTGAVGEMNTSYGTATSNSDESVTYASWALGSGSTGSSGQNSSNIIYLNNLSSGGSSIADLTALDTTNITLNFTTHAPEADVHIQWSVF